MGQDVFPVTHNLSTLSITSFMKEHALLPALWHQYQISITEHPQCFNNQLPYNLSTSN